MSWSEKTIESPRSAAVEVALQPRKGQRQSARGAICRRRVMTNSPNGGLSSFPVGFPVFLPYTMRRVNCRRCGIGAVEQVPWGDGKRTLTKAYMLFLT